ncbi:MAG: VCBS repeat-containing protein [Candidatus Cloacimonetes bacterium]|nr:VCBS repeat-containing protein [Candidatus Cloacimonadota bacterium]
MKKYIIISFLISVLILNVSAQIIFRGHILNNQYLGPWFVSVADIGNDDDVDIISAARSANCISWWENNGQQEFTQHEISYNCPYAMCVHALDIDGDEDIDIFSAIDGLNRYSWWENDGMQQFSEHIAGLWTGPNMIKGMDFDGDEDIDALVTACEGNPGRMGWLENDGQQNFTEHIVKDNWDHANCIAAVDIDMDMDYDLFGTASWASQLCFFQNNGDGTFTEEIIKENWGRPCCVDGGDLDGDEDMDIIASACLINEVIWLENNSAGELTEHMIDDNFAGPHKVGMADINNDGYMDVFGASKTGGQIVWWENNGQQGFTRYPVVTGLPGCSDVVPVDLDEDGDLDMVGVATQGNTVGWWENLLYGVNFTAFPLTGIAPLPVQFTDLSHFGEEIIAWAWDFNNDGIIDDTTQYPTWTYMEAGVFSVSLTVTTQNYEQYYIDADLISVFDQDSALLYNEQNSCAICAAAPALNLSGSLTMEAWIKPYTGGSYFNRIIDKQKFHLSYTCSFPLFAANSLVLIIEHEDGSFTRAGTPENSIQLDQWQHAAFSFDGIDDVAVYINGVPQELTYLSLSSGNIAPNEEYDLCLGNSAGGLQQFQGIIDEVRIWNRVLTELEIQINMLLYLNGSEDDLLANWQFNEGYGDSFADLCGNITDGFIQDAQWVQGLPLINGTAADAEIIIPDARILYNVPNPFNPSTVIYYTLKEPAPVKLQVYNLKGQLVETLCDEFRTYGQHQVSWNASTLTSGIYLVRLCYANTTAVSKMILLK